MLYLNCFKIFYLPDNFTKRIGSSIFGIIACVFFLLLAFASQAQNLFTIQGDETLLPAIQATWFEDKSASLTFEQVQNQGKRIK